MNEPISWGAFTLTNDIIYRAGHGPVGVLVRIRNGDWRITRLEESGPFGPPEPVEGVDEVFRDFDRQVLATGEPTDDGIIDLFPTLPDRPLVLRPPGPVLVPSETTADVFIGIPIMVNLRTLSPREHDLGAYPSEILSSTWRGDQAAGEPAYTLNCRFLRSASMVSGDSWVAVCPLSVRNITSGEFDMNGSVLETDYLGLWLDGGRLWTDHLVITVRGDGVVQYSVEQHRAGGDTDITQLSPSRRQNRRGRRGLRLSGYAASGAR